MDMEKLKIIFDRNVLVNLNIKTIKVEIKEIINKN